MPVTRTLLSSARAPGLVATVDKAGVVTGEAKPGTRVEVANLSVVPTGHLLPADVVETATADAFGKLADFLGRANTEVWLKDASVDDVWSKMERATTNQQAMACGTYPSSESALYRGTGLYANHAYSVVGMQEVATADGVKRMVTMRNPWGGSGFSGEFQLPIADFVRLYQVLNVC